MTHPFPLPPLSTIGIIGGGQLGRMLCVAAAKLGYQTHIFAPTEDCPAAQLANHVTVGSTKDPEKLSAFAGQVDVITFEFENIEQRFLQEIAKICPIFPDPKILALARDRHKEKQFLNDIGIKTAPWQLLSSEDDLPSRLNYPLIMKTTCDGYDGKGQARVTSEEECILASHRLKPAPFILEEKIAFTCEISVMVIRGQDGTIRCFDPAENIHKDGILDISLAPAPRTPTIRKKAQEMAISIAQELGLVGIMGVEFFLDENNNLLVNELAPRPHNSGHWTMDGSPYDQFDMHIRAVAGLTLPHPIRLHDVIMKNLIGPQGIKQFCAITHRDGFIPYLYGKKEAKAGRKMGHVNIPLAYDGLPGEFGINDILSAFDVEQ